MKYGSLISDLNRGPFPYEGNALTAVLMRQAVCGFTAQTTRKDIPTVMLPFSDNDSVSVY